MALTPSQLRLFKQQLPLRLRSMAPETRTAYLSKLATLPDFADVARQYYQAPRTVSTPQRTQPVVTQQKTTMPWEIQSGLPLWQTALSAFALPFNVISKTFGAAVTSPFTPSVKGTEGKGWLERELTEYEQTKMPWGVKFALETLPWLAVPAIGVVGKAGTIAGGLGKLGKAGEVTGKALQYSPWGLAERGTGVVLGKVGQVVKGAVGVKKPVLPDLDDINVAIQTATKPDKLRQLANLPGFKYLAKYIAGESAIAQKPEELAITGWNVLRAEGQLKTAGVVAPLAALGHSTKIFNLDDLQKVTTGPLKGISIDDITKAPGKYESRLTKSQKDWLNQLTSIEDEISPLLERNGIKINKIQWDEGERWSSRVVVGKLDTEGQLSEMAFVGTGGRPGLKPGFMKTRVFDNMEDATKEGFRYLPKEEAVAVNVQRAYNRISDEKMAKWLLARVPYRTTAMPAEIKIATQSAVKELSQAKNLKSVIMRTLRGEKLPEQTVASIERNFPDLNFRTVMGSKESLTLLKAKANSLISERQGIANTARSVSKEARERVIRPAYGEAMIPEVPVFAGKIFTGAEAKETVKFLRQTFTPQFSKALGAVNKVNEVGRVMALAGDMSPFGIQLIFLAGSHPQIFGKAMGAFWKGFADPDYLSKFYANHQETILNSKGLILSRATNGLELTKAYQRGGLLTFGPMKPLGKLLLPFQRGYEAALDSAGIYLKEAYSHLATTPEATASVEAFINEFRGLISTTRIGISAGQRQLESVAILAPQYNRAIGALVVDIGRGGLRGQLARDNMAKGVLGIMAMATAMSLAMGETPEQITNHLNPTSHDFMTWTVAGQRIGPGSKMRSLLALLGKVIKNPEDATYQAGRFLRGNFSPVVGTSMDLITGKNYIGDPTRDGLLNLTKTVVAENMLPVWVQGMVFGEGNLGGRAIRGTTEFVGGRANPLGTYGEMKALQDKLAQEQYNMNWSELASVKGPGKIAQMRLEATSPELQQLTIKAAEESATWARGTGVLWNNYNNRVKQVQSSVKQAINLASSEFDTTGDGNTFRQKINEVYAAQRMMFNDLKNDPQFAQIKEYFDSPIDESLARRMNPNDLAYKVYNQMMFGDDMVDEFGNYKFDEADIRRQTFIQRYGVESLNYIEELLDIKRQDEPEALKTLRQARTTLKPYWDIATQLWSQYPPQYQQIADQIAVLEQTDPTAARMLQRRYPNILFIRRKIALLKKQVKIRNPAIADALQTFY